jgi:hypothetical protein
MRFSEGKKPHMENRRIKDRKYLTYFSRVVDQNTGLMIGYLVDLSEDGAQLVGSFPIKIHDVFQLRIDLPENFSSEEFLDIEAEAMWSQPDSDPEFYRTGMRLVNFPEANKDILQRLLSNYSFGQA